MGCDIHEYVEYLRGDNWVRASNKKGPACKSCSGFGLREDIKCFICGGLGKKWFIYRNYMLFGILAGVRWREVDHIKPRGLPKDVSKSIKNNFNEGDHSASYFSLKELLELKNKKQVLTGYVNMEEYRNFKKNGYPDYWDEYIYKPMKLISNDEMDRRNKLVSFWDGEMFYTEISWEMTNGQIAGDFWNTFVPAMEKLHKDPEKVRFVFWFDN